MKKLLTVALLCGFACLTNAGDLPWMTDIAKAKAAAKAEKKIIMVNFTGSDWCGFCIKLDKEVLSTTDFADYAKKNLVLLYVDFPRSKPMSPQQKQANDALKKQFGVSGYPTLVFLNSDGKELGRKVGYGGGGPKAIIAEVEKAKKS